jgi:uncharacterized protein YkwD
MAPDVSIGADAAADALSFQQYNVMIINMYRSMGGLPALTLDSELSAFALAGSQELTQDHTPHAHFMNAGSSIWTMGFTSMAGENQGDPNGWRVLSTTNPTSNEEMQIAQIMQAMYDEGPPGDAGEHGHYENIMSTSFTRVGVGLIEVSNELYLTNDFSN